MQKPKRHYAPAIVFDVIEYVSGQLPIDEKREAQIGGIVVQTTLCLKNIENILNKCGINLNYILK